MRRAWGVEMFPARIYVSQIIAVFAIVLAAIWGATQWAAAALGHQAALGPAWFTVFGFPVYLPWRLSPLLWRDTSRTELKIATSNRSKRPIDGVRALVCGWLLAVPE